MATRTKKPSWRKTDAGILKHWIECCKAVHRQIKFFPQSGLGNRLQRLFAVACCRRIWHLLKDERSRRAVEIAELFADGRATDQERRQAWDNAHEVFAVAALSFAHTVHECATEAATIAASHAYWVARDLEQEWHFQGLILITFMAPEWTWDEVWRTSTVHALASGIYEDKAWDRMPILADALQDAGCDDDKILVPLRDESTQWYRGCRILDCILWREMLA